MLGLTTAQRSREIRGREYQIQDPLVAGNHILVLSLSSPFHHEVMADLLISDLELRMVLSLVYLLDATPVCFCKVGLHISYKGRRFAITSFMLDTNLLP